MSEQRPLIPFDRDVVDVELINDPPPKPEYPDSALPKSLETTWRACRFCQVSVRKGLTVKDNVAWFDTEPPHPNHWITCAKADTARRLYRRQKR